METKEPRLTDAELTALAEKRSASKLEADLILALRQVMQEQATLKKALRLIFEFYKNR